ncbi:GD16723 [Drosophila simulans]|uniref:GD16723 n=1 Tax=Drosophila simulans TaxID=7240 RepID=B4R4S8_DROSI|nr:GD16723 [Drosophila simulans]
MPAWASSRTICSACSARRANRAWRWPGSPRPSTLAARSRSPLGEIEAAVHRMTEDNQIMVADDIVFLI